MTISGSDRLSSAATDTAVFLLSAVLIASQIVMMQALARAQGHHFAYLVISLALLGFGCSGTVITLTRGQMDAHAAVLLPGFMLLAGLSCCFALPAALRMAARTDIHLLFLPQWRAWIPVLAAAILAFLPFFFGALVLGLIFVRDSRIVGRRYGANLLGSACGGGLGILLLSHFREGTILPLFSSILAGGALSLLVARPPPKGGRSWPAACGILFIGGAVASVVTADLAVSPYKALMQSLQLPDARIIHDRPHPMGRVEVVESPALRYGPGLSLAFRGEIPAAPRFYVAGDDYGTFLMPPPSESHFIDYSVQTLPLALIRPERVLVINAAASGAVISHLLRHGITHVKTLEPHPVVAGLLNGLYEGISGEANLELKRIDCRSFLKNPPDPYDLIMLPPQGSFGGGIGVQSLQENYLLTRESFQALWRSVKRDGIISVSAYNDRPPRQTLKLLSLITTAMREAGIAEPSRHVACLRSWEMLTLAASPRPMDDSDRNKIAAFAETMGFDRVWIPGTGPALTDQFHVMDNDFLEQGFHAILTPNAEEGTFIRAYPFIIDAPSDNQPYFNSFIRWNRLAEARRAMGAGSLAFMEMGSILVGLTAIMLAATAFILILAPLFRFTGTKDATGASTFVFIYFAGIGLGFMFLEIMWIQRFTLFWGHPLYSAAGVISALLCGMGIGSIAGSRLPPSRAGLQCTLVMLLFTVTAALIFIPRLFQAALALPDALKWIIGLTALVLPALVMGMPFPLALRLTGLTHPHLTAWAWGINGFFSLLAAPLAVLAAMQWGFTMVGWIAAGAYLTALLVSGLLGKPEEPNVVDSC